MTDFNEGKKYHDDDEWGEHEPKGKKTNKPQRGGKREVEVDEEAEMDEAAYSYSAARAGRDIGKPGKTFSKIAHSAGEKYGSEERGKKVAGAILAKIRAKHGIHEEAEELDELSDPTLRSYRSKRALDRRAARDEVSFQAQKQSEYGNNMPAVNSARKVVSKMNKNIALASKKLRKEEAEELDEVLDTSKKAKEYIRRAAFSIDAHAKGLGSTERANYDKTGEYKLGHELDPARDRKVINRHVGIDRALNKMARISECDMTDTSLSDIDASKQGEVYKKALEMTTAATKPTGTSTHVVAGKTGEAYNTTAINKRVPALESAIADVMAESLRKRKLYEEASNIAIISPEQRQDWVNVETGRMNFIDYLDKYKV